MESVLEQVESDVNLAIDRLNFDQITQNYQEQGEFLTIDQFFPSSVIDQFMADVDHVRPHLNRNYIPSHKKGGSISYYTLNQSAQTILSFYRSPIFLQWLSRLVNAPLMLCPEEDPHACALYLYTEPGDHIGFHYDTAYYKGARYTVLLGLRDRSTSRLVCRLHTKDPGHESKELSLTTDPGTLIVFNGDKLYHCVTPLGEGEERIVLTLQFVTDPYMTPFKRWFSNMKDAVGYFGLPALFRRPLQ